MTEIVLRIKHNDTCIDIEFPIEESPLYAKLAELHATDHEGDPFLVEKVLEPVELKDFFEGKSVDLDEINYLAKRMESFSGQEYYQFLAASRFEDHLTPRDLVNLTFNLQRYTLIRDMTNLQKVGVTHLLNKGELLTTDETKSPRMAEVGKELICSGKGLATEFGLLFINEDIPYETVYNSTAFPEYQYRPCIATVYLEHGEQTECLYLPEEYRAIIKAIKRLGCGSIDECSVRMEITDLNEETLSNLLHDIIENEGLYKANLVAKEIDNCDDPRNLAAAIRYADVEDADSVIVIAQSLDVFVFAKDVYDDYELGEYWIDKVDEYTYSPELQDYIDFEEYGKDVYRDKNGEYVDNYGFVGLDCDMRLSDILDCNEQGIGEMCL